MSKELDDLIEAKGWRKGQSVKLGYDDIEEYANQIAIERLRVKHSEVSTAKSIALKYVHGNHDALTDSQEVKDMTLDIEEYANQLVIDELEAVLKFNMELPTGNTYMSVFIASQLELTKRIQKLKQDE